MCWCWLAGGGRITLLGPVGVNAEGGGGAIMFGGLLIPTEGVPEGWPGSDDTW